MSSNKADGRLMSSFSDDFTSPSLEGEVRRGSASLPSSASHERLRVEKEMLERIARGRQVR